MPRPKKLKSPKPAKAVGSLFDYGTPHRIRKGDAVVRPDIDPNGAKIVRAVVTEPTPLDRYHHRGQLSDRQFEAGQHLAELFHRAITLPRVTATFSPTGGGSGVGHVVDTNVDARRKLWSLLVASGLGHYIDDGTVFEVQRRSGRRSLDIRGPVGLNELGHLVVAVVGFEDWAGGTRRLDKLRAGLDAMADHWGIPDPDRPVARKPRPSDSWRDPSSASTDMPEARDLSWAAEQAAQRRRAETARGLRKSGCRTDRIKA